MIPVIGIAGPMGSGKDLVADWLVKEKGFAKVSFADKMKSFCGLLFGFEQEALWGPSEARNEEHTAGDKFWAPAITRFPGIGPKFIKDLLGYKESPAEESKAFLELMDWFSWLRKNHPEKLSARITLQTLGTEWGRKVDPLIWVNYVHRNVIPSVNDGFAYSRIVGPHNQMRKDAGPKGVVIPDHRFKNEVLATQEHDGHVIRLYRNSQTGPAMVAGIPGHVSESEVKSITDDDFDLVLRLEEGVEKVYQTLEKAFTEKAWTHKRNAKAPQQDPMESPSL